jgi:hypothetical protein
MDEVYKMSQSMTSSHNSLKHCLQQIVMLEKRSNSVDRCSKNWQRRRNWPRKSTYERWRAKREKRDSRLLVVAGIRTRDAGHGHDPPRVLLLVHGLIVRKKVPENGSRLDENEDKKTNGNSARAEWAQRNGFK